MPSKPTVITLGVKDFPRALDFYKNGLGWQTTATATDDVAFFPMGSFVFALYPRHLLAEDATVSPEGSGFSGIALAINLESETAVDAFFEKVQTLGASPVKQPQKVFWGGYSGYFRDLDGHLWEVAYNPFWTIDERGNVLLHG